MKGLFDSTIKGMNELVLVIGIIGILLVLFTPISAFTLDFLLLVNLCLSLLILLVTFYTEKPLSFSTFPSLLLMTTLFRLALNISATRLILDDAEAGKVIDAVGKQVVGGNYIIGLVVFLILIVVQFVVVTNGSQRVAEVAARFILDSLPGKQMSIDADLNMGVIDQDEAKKRRADLEKESNFYGAMDGASKFVKGDAIAGIIIILIDIIGGLTIGIAQKDMAWGEALHVYTLLTVGDGIVTQIPSLIIAVSAGIIITRAATDSRLAMEITKQFSAHPKTLIIAAVALLGLLAIPGIPTVPVLTIVFALCVLAWLAHRKSSSQPADKDKKDSSRVTSEEDESTYEMLRPQPFEIGLGRDLAQHYLSASSEFESRVANLKKQFAQKFGVVLPALSMDVDNKLKPEEYSLRILGVEVGVGEIRVDKLLAIHAGKEKVSIEGEKTREPTYGLEAQWIDNAIRAQAHTAGYTLVEPETVLITHIQELCHRNCGEFITRAETERLVESQRDNLGSLIDELVPAVLTYSDIQRVLQLLVTEQVPIKNLESILEVLVDSGRTVKDVEALTEKVREKLSASICTNLNDSNGTLNVITLAANLERKIVMAVSAPDSQGIGLSPQELEAFVSSAAKESEKMLGSNIQPTLLCAPVIRRQLRNLLQRSCPQLHVLSTSEINKHPNISAVALIDIDQKQVGDFRK